jgi:hypothetical protein
VGEERAGKPAADLHEALGGAKTVKPPTPKPAAQPQAPGEDETTTSRLLRAKRKPKPGESEQ